MFMGADHVRGPTLNSRPICHMEMIYYKILRIFFAVTRSFP